MVKVIFLFYPLNNIRWLSGESWIGMKLSRLVHQLKRWTEMICVFNWVSQADRPLKSSPLLKNWTELNSLRGHHREADLEAPFPTFAACVYAKSRIMLTQHLFRVPLPAAARNKPLSTWKKIFSGTKLNPCKIIYNLMRDVDQTWYKPELRTSLNSTVWLVDPFGGT